MKRLLMVAFHFPPAAMGSGHLRTLGFARYLPECGWQPTVLSAKPLAYPRVDRAAEDGIPTSVDVHRAFALDAGRHFAIAGKYPGFIATPDRWATWWPSAVWRGLRLIRRRRMDAIWSTYPIMTAHRIAYTLARITKLPWVADFRDPVSGSVSTVNAYAMASQRRWEARVLANATRVTFTTPGALREYASRYPTAVDRLAVIENGYDEAAFANLSITAPLPVVGRPVRLVHSGLLYPDGRNPMAFFTALARLRGARVIGVGDVHITLRASGSEAAYQRELDRLGLDGLVTLAPAVSNHEALIEQADADGLLLFQGARFNRQIPAKLYEYLRVGRPIFALADPAGDTAEALRHTGGADVVPMDDAGTIAARFAAFLDAVRRGRAQVAGRDTVARCSRQHGTRMLSGMLDAITMPAGGGARPDASRRRMTSEQDA